MNILITNLMLANYAGTECYVRDLSIALKKRGFGVEVYSPVIGRIANDIMSEGINVTNSVNQLQNVPDLIHGQHKVAINVINKFPNTPVIFFCHSIDMYCEPLIHPNIKKYVSVSDYVAEVLLIPKFEKDKIRVIYNWVDTEKFKQKNIFNDKISKALMFCTDFVEDKVNIIYDACNEKQIQLERLGFHNLNNVNNPQDVLPNYDVVFAIGKSAIESISCGNGVILCGFNGLLGSMVDSSNFDYARRFNFGLKNLTRNLTKELIIEELSKYNPIEIKKVSDRIRIESSFEKTLNEIIELYNEVLK